MATKTKAELLQDISNYIANKVGKVRKAEHGGVVRDVVESIDKWISDVENGLFQTITTETENRTTAIAELNNQKQDKTDPSLQTDTKTIVGAINELNNLIPKQEYVEINGVKWATCNVDGFGTFTLAPESAGMLYQWNRPKAWAATGSVSGWDSTIPTGTTWKKSNDPSPNGWRVPTKEELQSLLDTTKVNHEWVMQNNVNGLKITDILTGNSIFLPAAGSRNSGGSSTEFNSRMYYWGSSTSSSENSFAYRLYAFLYSGNINSAVEEGGYKANGLPIRPVLAIEEPPKAKDVTYDNSESELEATDAQGAIDEVTQQMVKALSPQMEYLGKTAQMPSDGSDWVWGDGEYGRAKLRIRMQDGKTTFDASYCYLLVCMSTAFSQITFLPTGSFSDGNIFVQTNSASNNHLLFPDYLQYNVYRFKSKDGSSIVSVINNAPINLSSVVNVTSPDRSIDVTLIQQSNGYRAEIKSQNSGNGNTVFRIESFPFSTNEGARSIDAGFTGFAFKNDFECQITRVCSFVQTNHTSGSFQFAIYKASDRNLVTQTVARNFSDFPIGEIYADFDETAVLEANTMYYVCMFINHTDSRYLMAKRFRTELSGTGDFVNNTGVFQSVVQGTDYEPNSILSSISRTFPNTNQIDVPYINIS